MDNIFLNGLKEIKKADPDRTVEGMFQLFRSIEDMDLGDLVASKRTLNLFRSLAKMEKAETEILDQLDEALITRAATLFHKHPEPRDDRDGYVKWANERRVMSFSLVSAFDEECVEKRIFTKDD